MTGWEVKEYLGQLTDWEDSDEESILSLCKSALGEIDAMLKADADRNDVRIASAAASLAYYKLTIKRSFSAADEITSFKAGDVSITQGGGNSTKQLANAEKLYNEALKSILPLCTDNSFAFENILIRVKI